MVCKRAKVKAGNTGPPPAHTHKRFKILQALYFYLLLDLIKNENFKIYNN